MTYLGVPIELHGAVGSTNDEALRRADEGAAQGLVIVAEEQTAGRGRQPAHPVRNRMFTRSRLERRARDGDSPVADGRAAGRTDPKYPGTRETLGESGGTTLQG